MNRRDFFRTLAGAAISAASWCYAGPKLLKPVIAELNPVICILHPGDTPLETWFKKVAATPVDPIAHELARNPFAPRRFMGYARKVAGDPPPSAHEWLCDEIMPNEPDPR